jgi:hypothetical protein
MLCVLRSCWSSDDVKENLKNKQHLMINKTLKELSCNFMGNFTNLFCLYLQWIMLMFCNVWRGLLPKLPSSYEKIFQGKDVLSNTKEKKKNLAALYHEVCNFFKCSVNHTGCKNLCDM